MPLEYRGIAKLRGEQIANGVLRDHHFDPAHPISENKVAINWLSHKETLEATKIDTFFVEKNVAVSGLSSIDISSLVAAHGVSNGTSEGIRTDKKVLIRVSGSVNTPVLDQNGNIVYGKIEQDAVSGNYLLKFYSGADSPFTMPDGTSIDYQFVKRTNLANIPVEALIYSEDTFVESKDNLDVLNNLKQLAKDLYGDLWRLKNDGTNLLTAGEYGLSVLDRIENFIAAVKSVGGAGIVGVAVSTEYSGTTVHEVLTELATLLNSIKAEVAAARERSATTNNVFSQKSFTAIGDRLSEIEVIVDAEITAAKNRLTKLETEEKEEVFVATGTETEYLFINGPAKPGTVMVFLNGQLQAPEVNITYVFNESNQLIGVNFGTALTANDVLFVKYRKL